VVFNFSLTGVTAAAALVQPFLPGADQVALVLALVMVRLPCFLSEGTSRGLATSRGACSLFLSRRRVG